jgi:hypothetical protein
MYKRTSQYFLKQKFRIRTKVGECYLFPRYSLYSEQGFRNPSETLVVNQKVSVASGDHVFIHTYKYIHLHTCIHTYIHTYLHIYMHTYIHVHIHG